MAKLYNAQEQIKCLTVNIFFQRSNVYQEQWFFILFDLLNSLLS